MYKEYHVGRARDDKRMKITRGGSVAWRSPNTKTTGLSWQTYASREEAENAAKFAAQICDTWDTLLIRERTYSSGGSVTETVSKISNQQPKEIIVNEAASMKDNSGSRPPRSEKYDEEPGKLEELLHQRGDLRIGQLLAIAASKELKRKVDGEEWRNYAPAEFDQKVFSLLFSIEDDDIIEIVERVVTDK